MNRLLPVILPLILAVPAAAQNIVCFSFEGATTSTTGKDNTGGTSKTGVLVGGFGSTFFDPGLGASPKACADACAAALAGKGFAVRKVGDNVVCVDSGPGGRPLMSGGGVGTTDTGIKGIDCEVFKPKPPPAKGPGIAIPKLVPGKVVPGPAPGRIRIVIEIEIIVNGQPTRVRIEILIQVLAQMPTDQLNQQIQQQLASRGIVAYPVRYAPIVSVQPTTTSLDGWMLQKDRQGNQVVHVIYELESVPMELVSLNLASAEPLFGCSNYGVGSPNGLPRTATTFAPNPPRLNSFFDVFTELAPAGSVDLRLMSPQSASLPLPMLGGGALLVDPFNFLMFPSAVDAAGRSQLSLPIPADRSLVGAALHWQSVLLDSRGQLSSSDGLRTVIDR